MLSNMNNSTILEYRIGYNDGYARRSKSGKCLLTDKEAYQEGYDNGLIDRADDTVEMNEELRG